MLFQSVVNQIESVHVEIQKVLDKYLHRYGGIVMASISSIDYCHESVLYMSTYAQTCRVTHLTV
jgi:hypothetical protein